MPTVVNGQRITADECGVVVLLVLWRDAVICTAVLAAWLPLPRCTAIELLWIADLGEVLSAGSTH